ncbi:hypothetical protein CJ184_003075 [Actinotignum urinale]|uniref:hypothetical protein n=1 Tax=Actinotignum urinale TaxID=190146 RepID=UPI0011AF0CC1|nr:hypothetical protein [Actinotignum urinale]WIK59638.1 hypothetical protein CJ184_003075 [Actinotignum urinale]
MSDMYDELNELGREIDEIAEHLGAVPEPEPGEPGYSLHSWGRIIRACRTAMKPVDTTDGLRLPIAIGPNLKHVELIPMKDTAGRSYLNLYCRVGKADLIDIHGLAGWVFTTFSLGDVRMIDDQACIHVAVRLSGLTVSRLMNLVKFLVVATIDATAVFVGGLDNVPPKKGELFGEQPIVGMNESLDMAFTTKPEVHPHVGATPGDADQYKERADVDESWAKALERVNIDASRPVFSWKDVFHAVTALIPETECGESVADALPLRWVYPSKNVGESSSTESATPPTTLVLMRNQLPTGADTVTVAFLAGEATLDSVPRFSQLCGELAAGGVVVVHNDVLYVHAFELTGQTLAWVIGQIDSAANNYATLMENAS